MNKLEKKLKLLFTMKVSIEMISRKAMVSINGLQGISTKAITKLIRDTFSARCIGMMAVSTKAIGMKESNMAMEKCILPMVMLKKAILRMVFSRSKVMNKLSRTI